MLKFGYKKSYVNIQSVDLKRFSILKSGKLLKPKRLNEENYFLSKGLVDILNFCYTKYLLKYMELLNSARLIFNYEICCQFNSICFSLINVFNNLMFERHLFNYTILLIIFIIIIISRTGSEVNQQKKEINYIFFHFDIIKKTIERNLLKISVSKIIHLNSGKVLVLIELLRPILFLTLIELPMYKFTYVYLLKTISSQN
ncbi:hypothetical protein BpHYR1_052147 [Brachionus plicatilis]|uniref:Uncharacterized protein n=1 Tax=Brachionus plicatilis TaxID=10195 RepID=A0A3M7R4E5_BRAPC|nr:hypothetical protein BpHYR1_052147 [Brachionus plicatilis]